ncbi:MAG TPA: alpha/beta fold hydrolase [Thermoanaerobaculia bacterium]|jgi:pimeloyl-ACP methyl ester carboxylesterase
MPDETYLSFGEDVLFCRHNEIFEHRPSILLIHGLGDSGLSFAGIFADERSREFNIVIPDLLGYGRSSHSPTLQYSFDVQIDHLWRIVDHFGLEEITVVGHSMGGDLGTLLCWQDLHRAPSPGGKPKIVGFVNVEGNLTEWDLFISGEAARAAAEGRFEEWFTWDFAFRKVYGDWCQCGLFGRRYLASLQFCDPAAFRLNAIELKRRGAGAGTSYRDLDPIPKLFVFGQKSLDDESRRFASRNGLKGHEIIGGHHWPMLDCPEEFYDKVFRFCHDKEVGDPIAEQEDRGKVPVRRRVAQVRVGPAAEYDDPSVQATLSSSNIPWLIRQAREKQDRILEERYRDRAIRIADIGCGDAHHAEMFAAQCSFYHGYERSLEMVKLARDRCARFNNVEIIEGDALKAKLGSEKYDVIWCLYFTPGNLREIRELLSDYDDAYLDDNSYFIAVIHKFFAALEEGGSLFLTLYKDTPQAEEAQRSFYWRTGQLVLTDFGSRFVATDKGFWSRRWSQDSVLAHLEKAHVPREDVAFIDLNEIAWLVEAKRKAN